MIRNLPTIVRALVELIVEEVRAIPATWRIVGDEMRAHCAQRERDRANVAQRKRAD